MLNNISYKVLIDSKFILIRKIGSGLTSNVFLSENKNTKELAAIKIINQSSKKNFENELIALKEIIDPNVIKLIEAGKGVKYNNYLGKETNIDYMALEYAEKGDLLNYVIIPKRGFEENQTKYIFLSILKGLKAIHDKGFAHRDIKLNNVFLTGDFKIKIGDFGFSKKLQKGNRLRTKMGSLLYCAPEIFSKEYDPYKVDIFALGVCLFILRLGVPPFRVPSNFDPKFKLLKLEKFNEFWDLFQEKLSNDFKDLFCKLISFDPENRPETNDIFEHPWIKNSNLICNEIEMKEEFLNRENIISQENQLALVEESSYNEAFETYRGIKKDPKINNYYHNRICNCEKGLNFYMNNFLDLLGDLIPA